MSKSKTAERVKLIMSLLSACPELLHEALRALAEQYGEIEYMSVLMHFDWTDYYDTEMGTPLQRRFIAFASLIRPEFLPDVKGITNCIEERFMEEGKRKVNIDPGYISRPHLILATGKGYAHRPYLRDGVYADLTLIYRGKTFTPLPWTYPDYAEEKLIGMFNKIRERYLEQLRTGRRTDGAVEQ